MIHDIRFPGGIPTDIIEDITGAMSGGDDGQNRSITYQKNLRGEDLDILASPHAEFDEQHFGQITLPSSDLTTWSIEALMRLPYPIDNGAFLRFLSGGYQLRMWSGMIDDNEGNFAIPIPDNRWFKLTIIYNSSGSTLYIDDQEMAAWGSGVGFFGGAINIGAYNSGYEPHVSFGYVRFWDELLPAPTEAPIPGENNSRGTFDGAHFMEEYDSSGGPDNLGGQALITKIGDNGADIVMDNQCWGCLMGNLPTDDYFKMSARFNWDDYLVGNNHIGASINLISIHPANGRGDIKTQVCLEYNQSTDVADAILLRTANDAEEWQETVRIEGPFATETDLAVTLEITDTEVIYIINGTVYTLARSFTTFGRYICGLNLGMHFLSPWTMRVRDWELWIDDVDYGTRARKLGFSLGFNGGMNYGFN